LTQRGTFTFLPFEKRILLFANTAERIKNTFTASEKAKESTTEVLSKRHRKELIKGTDKFFLLSIPLSLCERHSDRPIANVAHLFYRYSPNSRKKAISQKPG
jgi:hypothetical protein